MRRAEDAHVREPPIREGGLQIEEQRAFQRLFWKVERCAWAAFMVLLLLVLAGLTGAGGYLSRATAVLATGDVEYPSISRWESSDELKAAFATAASPHRFTLGAVFFEYFEVEAVHPQAERALATRGGTTWEFAAEPGVPLEITIYVRALRPGFPHYSVALDSTATDVSTVILP